MKMISKTTLSLTMATLGLAISASAASAAVFTPLPGFIDSNFNTQKSQGLFQEDWVAEGRIGGTTTFEQGIVNWTTNTNNNTPVNANFPWASGQVVPFTVQYEAANGGKVTYTLGGQIISASNLTEASRFPNGLNTLYLRTRSVTDSTATLQNLLITGMPPAYSGILSSSGNGSGNGDVDYLQITGLSGDFTLQGEAILSWTGVRPTQSQLAFQVKGGYAIPEPLTMLGVGTALGFGTFFKQQLAKNQKKDKTKA